VNADNIFSKISEGFYLGKTFPWGTEYEDVKKEIRCLDMPERSSGKWRICSVDIKTVYGFSVVLAEFTAGNSNRPVMHVDYEIAYERLQKDQSEDAAYFLKAITDQQGAPAESKHHPKHSANWSSGNVKFSARWQESDVMLNLSLYGAPRSVRGGMAIGCLSLRWENEVRAASPYLQKLLREEQAFATEGGSFEIVSILPLESEPSRFGQYYGERAFDSILAKSRVCLRKANILETPAALREKLSKNEIAIWRSSTMWGVSTYFDTSRFSATAYTEIKAFYLLPAKGQGSSSLYIGELTLKGSPKSPQIAAIVEALRKMPNTLASISEDLDC
jgi:hypothetical protein